MTTCMKTRRSRSRQQLRKNHKLAARAAHALEVVELNVATRGLSTGIYDAYEGGERDDWHRDEWEPNLQWSSVHIRREDIVAWMKAYEDQLAAWWTPNQEWNGLTDYYASMASDAKVVMDHLESLAWL